VSDEARIAAAVDDILREEVHPLLFVFEDEVQRLRGRLDELQVLGLVPDASLIVAAANLGIVVFERAQRSGENDP